jgi:predicted alpha-1,2-mannosidase
MGDGTGNAGWLAVGDIQGFSQTHVSGTGGGAKYGNILLQPTSGPLNPADHASPRLKEVSHPGLYEVTLGRYGIRVSIAAGSRSALYRFTYPASTNANLLFDVEHCLSSYPNQNEDQRVTSSHVRILSPTEIEGDSSVTGGWNQQTTSYTVYFYALADTAFAKSGTWRKSAVLSAKSLTGDTGVNSGAWMQFPSGTRTVHLKVGISFVSTSQARANAMSEFESFDFARAVRRATAVWDKALGAITLRNVDRPAMTMLYSALYHSMLMPVDRTGENPLWESGEPSYDDFYAIWDTFRTSSPLLTLVAPERESAIVRALIDIYRHEGFLPDARSGNYNGRTQGGSDADMVIVDAYLKHLPGIDWQTAWSAVQHDAEVEPANQWKEGRGGLDDWKRLNYLSIESVDRPASKTLEYAANDYALSLFAAGIGKSGDAALYRLRAQNWKNLWNPALTDAGFSGFIWPRHRDGKWRQPFDPLLQGTWGGDNFYEGNAWTYSTYVPQDVAGLIAVSGGPKRFVERMDAFFTLPGRYDVGNEPGFLAPYLDIWTRRPDRTQYWIRHILTASYHTGPNGLPGNDDSGAMSSWFIFGSLGFYPVAAQDLYLFGSPSYSSATLRLENCRSLTLQTVHHGSNNPYIESVTWNGRPWDRAWFTHEELLRGGTLRFTMGAKPSSWGSQFTPSSMTGKLGQNAASAGVSGSEDDRSRVLYP